ncbi:hypothetical protein D3C76_1780010 [compost metagenome]
MDNRPNVLFAAHFACGPQRFVFGAVRGKGLRLSFLFDGPAVIVVRNDMNVGMVLGRRDGLGMGLSGRGAGVS